MLRILRVSALVLALSFNVTAGEIQYGATEPPPPQPQQEQEQTVTTNSTQTSDGQESSTTEELQALINLLGYLLPLI